MFVPAQGRPRRPIEPRANRRGSDGRRRPRRGRSLPYRLALAAALAALACVRAAAGPAAAAERVPEPTQYSQAPYLAAIPDLPPLEDRLPLAPLVWSAALPEPAAYGGRLRVRLAPRAVEAAGSWLLAENFLATPGAEGLALRGNLVESFQVHPALTHFRFALRRGLRWSDGAPVTTADVAFAYEAVWRNDDLNFLGLPAYLRTGGHPTGPPPQLIVLDDYAFALAFDAAYGSFPGFLARHGPHSYADLLKPAHYLKAYHPDYVPFARMAELLTARGLRYPWELFAAADCQPAAARAEACRDFPVLWPWTPTDSAGDPLRLARNPYYHKVDAAGRQLPYLDTVILAAAPRGAARAHPVAGAFDLLLADEPWRWALQALPPTYRVQWRETPADRLTLFLNRTFPDAEWRALASDPDFRRALLLAADGASLSARLFADGAGPPAAAAAFDPGQARARLDALGLDTRDAAGWRQTPRGAAFRLTIEYDAEQAACARAARHLAARWRDVGLHAQAAATPPRLLAARTRANQVQALLGRAEWDGRADDPRGIRLRHEAWGPQWALWRATQGRQGEEPPPAVRHLYDLYAQQARVRAGTAAQAAVTRQIRARHAEGQFGLPLTARFWHALVLDSRLRNVPGAGTAQEALQAGEGFFLRPAAERPADADRPKPEKRDADAQAP